MKRAFIFMIVCASLGTILAAWLAPRFISWYFEPPVDIGVNCRPAVDWGIQKYQWSQIGGLIAGSVAGLVLYFAFGRRQKTLPTSKPLS